jgi:hypothetical protein
LLGDDLSAMNFPANSKGYFEYKEQVVRKLLHGKNRDGFGKYAEKNDLGSYCELLRKRSPNHTLSPSKF